MPSAKRDHSRHSVAPAVRVALSSLLVLVALFAVVRALFLALYLRDAPSAWDLLRCFGVGLRFDLAAAAVVLAPVALGALLPFAGERAVRQARWLARVAVVLAAAALAFVLGDVVYFAHSGKRMSYEAAAMLREPVALLSFAGSEHPLLLPALFLSWAAATAALLRFARLMEVPPLRPGAWSRLRAIGWALLVVGLFVLLFRGGVRPIGRRLRLADAYFGGPEILHHAALNPIYTLVAAVGDDRRRFDFMPDEEAESLVRRLLADPAERFADERYPLLRERPGSTEPRFRDVVVLLLESLSAETIHAWGGPHDVTPTLDRLSRESLRFDRFYSSGSRSSHGLFATLFSVPAQPGKPVLHTALVLDRFTSLPGLLRGAGFETWFFYGGIYEFTNALGVLRHAGFEHVVSAPDPARGAPRRRWGYDDEYMLAELADRMARPSDRPRLFVLFTMNLHGGRSLPARWAERHADRLLPKGTRHRNYYNLLAYTDDCLGAFFERVRRLPRFDETLFVLLADHTNHKDPSLLGNYHIPLLLHAPARIAPRRVGVVGSQVDVLPTVLGLLGLEARHASFGRDLLAVEARGEPGFAFLTLDPAVGWVEGDLVARDALGEGPPVLFDAASDPQLRLDLAPARPDVAADFSRKARAFLQVSRRLLLENRIAPP